MTNQEWYDSLDEGLRALTVHDVSAECAERTRDRVLAAIAARRPGARDWSAGPAWLAWGEPLAAIGIGVAYLAAAVRASMVLFGQ
jgi:hypothetical protein